MVISNSIFMKKLSCCSHDGTTNCVHQGLQNPQSGPPRSPRTALSVLPPANHEGEVALEQPLEVLKNLLDLQTNSLSSCVVVIYGCGGIGKTTLANALVASLSEDLKFYNYTKVENYGDPSQNVLKRMRLQIMKDCFPPYLRKELDRWHVNKKTEPGFDLFEKILSYYNEKKPAFIFIDNVIRPNDLEQLLLERLGYLPPRSRILVTTRDMSVTDFFEYNGIPCNTLAVNPLAKEHAFKFLCNDPTHFDQIRNHVEKITEIARGIPLALKIVGAYLRKHGYNLDNCSQILKFLEDGRYVKEENLSESLVHFVYDDLEPSTQEAFLDICSFFNGWPRRWVEYIVGVEQLTLLEQATLVTSLPFINSVTDPEKLKEYDLDVPKEIQDGVYLPGENKLIVQSLIQEKGRRLGESTRIMDLESWSQATKCQGGTIKGVKLHSNEDILAIEQSELTRIGDSLRILILGSGISISAGIKETFKELRCLILNGQIDCCPMNLEWHHPCLTFYAGPVFNEVLSKLPPNLKYLMPQESSTSDVGESIKSFVVLQNDSLEDLDLTGLEKMLVMFDGKLHFLALKILSLKGWEQMEELPPQVCNLPSLNKLILRECGSLKRAPITNLRVLTHLDLRWCSNLEEVCSSLGELTMLRYLDLTGCKRLRVLPDNFGQLSDLEYLSLRECYSLQELPGSFSQLRSLKELDLSYCSGLKELPSNFVQLRSIQVLWMYNVEHKFLGEFNQIDSNWKIIY